MWGKFLKRPLFLRHGGKKIKRRKEGLRYPPSGGPAAVCHCAMTSAELIGWARAMCPACLIYGRGQWLHCDGWCTKYHNTGD